MSTEKCWYEKMKDADREKLRNLMAEAVQDYTEKICYAINPIDVRDMPFILTALKSIEKNLSKDNKVDDLISEFLASEFVAQRTDIPVPKNATQEDIDRMKEQFFKNSRGRDVDGTV